MWASSAIPKGDLSSPRSARLGEHLHPPLGKGGQCKPSPSLLHLPGPQPLPLPGQPRGPEHRQPGCELTLPREPQLSHTRTHAWAPTCTHTWAHTLPQEPPLLCRNLSHPSHMQKEAQRLCETGAINVVTNTIMQSIGTKGHGGTVFLAPYRKAISAALTLEPCPAMCVLAPGCLVSCYQPRC